MKKFLWFLSFMIIGGANAATPWWEQPTICRLDPSNCYANMGTGYDRGMWDATANCWGLKLICPEALSPTGRDVTPVGRGTLAAGTGLNTDFDINVLNGDCFGTRKTGANGTTALVNGSYVNVWCNGILNRPDETLPNGEISYTTQPTCGNLAAMGYVAIVNNKCYGKHFNEDEYLIECTGSNLLPSRIIVLNGADYTTGTSRSPADQAAADEIFDTMYANSKKQHKIYFDE